MPACARSPACCGLEANAGSSTSASPRESSAISIGSTSNRFCRESEQCSPASAALTLIFLIRLSVSLNRRKCSTACVSPALVKRLGRPTLSASQACTAGEGDKECGRNLFNACARRFCRSALEAVGKRISDRVTHHVLVLTAQECMQPVRVHDVLTGHIGECLRWNRRDLPLP